MRRAAALGALATLALGMAACSTYPSEPRYSTRPVPIAVQPASTGYVEPAMQPGAYEPPPNAVVPREDIQGGGLAPVGVSPANPYDSPPAQPEPTYDDPPPAEPVYSAAPPPATETAYEPPVSDPPPAPVMVAAGASYEVQSGDTLYGIGRRFQAPIQTLVDLNALGPRAAIRPGMRLTLPDSAVDLGPEERASGPSPRGVRVPAGTAPPPPPPPPSGNAATPRPMPAAPGVLNWPVRGEILSRFGATGVSQRNSGVDIGTAEGAEVRASAAGRVYYVGNVVADQGLTVLIVHPDGWRTVYAHLGSERVSEGQDVAAGEVIGTAGRTPGNGPSMHFQVWRVFGDEPRPVDPLTVLPR
jgi:murein DD-endopeptidase MepM/ murein hydrolase activator NlpD